MFLYVYRRTTNDNDDDDDDTGLPWFALEHWPLNKHVRPKI